MYWKNEKLYYIRVIVMYDMSGGDPIHTIAKDDKQTTWDMWFTLKHD